MIKALLSLTLGLAMSAVSHAHHSSAMFDKSKVMEVTATVTEFQWTNPHVWIEITVTSDDGAEEAWSIEGLGPNGLFRNGWRPDSFKAGDRIEIRFYPMHDGSNAGGFVGARFSDGRVLGSWN
jgi:hypothetical protein